MDANMQAQDTVQPVDGQAVEPKVNLSPTQEGVYRQLIEAGHDKDEALTWVQAFVDAPDAPNKPHQPFAVTDEATANWVMKKMAYLTARIAGLAAAFRDEVEALEVRQNNIVRPLARELERFELVYGPQLEALAERMLADSKAKHVDLHWGKIGFGRKSKATVIHNEPVALEFLENVHPEAVIITKSISKSALKAFLEGLEGGPRLFLLNRDGSKELLAEVEERGGKFEISLVPITWEVK